MRTALHVCERAAAVSVNTSATLDTNELVLKMLVMFVMVIFCIFFNEKLGLYCTTCTQTIQVHTFDSNNTFYYFYSHIHTS